MTVLTIDSDLITFFKFAVWAGSVFLAVYALIGIGFFGWDVTKARSSLKDAEKEVREQLRELRTDFKELRDLKERLEELGAQLSDLADDIQGKKRTDGNPPQAPDDSGGVSPPESPRSPGPPGGEVAMFARGAPIRSDVDLVREVLLSSSFEWTTINRLMKKTGFSQEQVLSIARSDPSIEIGFGRRTKEHLFKIKNNGL